MKLGETFDDRHGLINHPYLHYGTVITAVNFAAGVDSGAAAILCNAAITVTLPLAATCPGKAFWIKQISAAASTVACTGADTIEANRRSRSRRSTT